MNRRTLLRAAASAAAVATTTVAGCIDAGEDPATDEPTGEPTEEPPTEPTTEPDDGSGDRPALREVALERLGNCDERGTGASVAFEPDSETVTVTGCFEAHNGCVYPELDRAAYAEAGNDYSFVIDVDGVDESEPDEACTQAVEYRDYEVVAEFDGGLPGRVEVRHDGETVTAADAE